MLRQCRAKKTKMTVLVQVFKQFSSVPQGHLQELFAPRFTEHELRDVTGKAAKKFFKKSRLQWVPHNGTRCLKK